MDHATRTVLRHSLTAAAPLAILLVGLTLVVAGNRAAAQAGPAPGGERVPVIISFSGQPGAAHVGLVRAFGGTERFVYHLIPAIAADIPANAVAALQSNPLVTHVEPDARIEAADLELDNSWGVQHIGAGEVHATNNGTGVKIAIIDTGIDYTHPELDGNYAGGYDFRNGDDDPFDDHSHGTHVAGIAAAADNNAGVVGVAPAAQLYAYKVLGADGSGNYSYLIAALECATGSIPGGVPAGATCVKVDVANMSLGGSADSPAVEAAVEAAHGSGVTLVASAGNVGTMWELIFGCPVRYPAAYDAYVMAVTFTDPTDSLTGYSCTGPAVDFAAPGDLITSSVPGDDYEPHSGTSMASPHVAGTAALLIASGMSDPDAIEARLCATTTPGQGSQPENPHWYGCGVVSAANALATDGNSSPGASDDAYALDEDQPLSVATPGVLANDGDADGDPLTAALVSTTANGSLTLNSDGSFAYTPGANFNGVDSFTYRANDGASDSTVATVTITVNPVNDAPTAGDDGYSTAEGSPLAVAAPGVLASDDDIDGDPLSASLMNDVSSGSLTLNGDGSFVYTPDAGFTGTDGFTYVASDGLADSTVATVTIDVNAANSDTAHVGDLDGVGVKMSKGRWGAIITIVVHDAGDGAVSDATVEGLVTQGGETVGVFSCDTDASGTCVIDTGLLPGKSGKASFTVLEVSRATLSYDAGANHDPDGDSDGTTIDLSK